MIGLQSVIRALDKVEDSRGLDTIFNKVAELSRQLEAKRAELKEEQRRNRRPPGPMIQRLVFGSS